MKKINLFSSAFVAALMLASCSTNDDAINDGGSTKDDVTQYVTVNLVDAGSTGTRADDDYEDGDASEYKVNSVRFYFFNANNAAYTFTGENNSGQVSYKDVDYSKVDDETTNFEKPNVTVVKSAQLILNGVTTDAPASVIAVVNPSESIKTLLGTQPSLSDVKTKTADVSSTESGFLMTNSVYSKEPGTNGVEYCEQAITAENIAYTEQAAKEVNPVNIYVERALAKVKVAFDPANFTDNIQTLKQTYKIGTTTTENTVKVKVLGWGVADTEVATNVMKKITATWTNAQAGGFSETTGDWTNLGYHRSFWATSVGSTTRGNSAFSSTIPNQVYTQENTQGTKTKVILYTQLLDNSGNTLELVQYHGQYYAGIAALKTQILAETAKYVKAGTTAGTYTPLTADDITIVNKNDNGYSSLDIKSYEAVAQVNVDVYLKTGDATVEQENGAAKNYKETVNKSLAGNPAQIWNEGKCYYFTEIPHIGSENGVVRNHVYQLNIGEITGFGTPVFDPTDIIVPEKPSDRKIYCAAKLKVLSWRIVKKNITLSSSK